jgi:dGTP triphosphohydrolase
MCCVELERIQPNALYEAVMLARDAAHVPFGNAGEILRSTSLVDIGGQMNDRTREIIVAMFEGELLDLRMLTPSKFLK